MLDTFLGLWSADLHFSTGTDELQRDAELEMIH
jgi:hypothetical protein